MHWERQLACCRQYADCAIRFGDGSRLDIKMFAGVAALREQPEYVTDSLSCPDVGARLLSFLFP